MVKKGLKANIIQWSIDIVVTASIWTFCMRVKERERVRKNVNLLYFLRLLLASCHIDGSVVLLKVLIKKREEKKTNAQFAVCVCIVYFGIVRSSHTPHTSSANQYFEPLLRVMQLIGVFERKEFYIKTR